MDSLLQLGPGARVGAPDRSEILHRLNLKEGGRTPLLGSERTDDEGAELIILQLKP